MEIESLDIQPFIEDGGIDVLHVDDEVDFVELASVYLERESDRIEVRTEDDPRDALEQNLGSFDCVVSDYSMPSMNGLEFFREVKENHPELPFILFTGKGSEELADEALSEGVTDYFRKETGTGQFAVLANRIENIVRKERIERIVREAFEAMETISEGIGILDTKGKFVYVNPGFAKMFGYKRSDIVGDGWKTLYAGEEEVLSRVEEEGCHEGEATYTCEDGENIRVYHILSHTLSGTVCFVRNTEMG